MRILLLIITFFAWFGLNAQTKPFVCGGDTLETWQGVRYCYVVKNDYGRIPKKGDRLQVNYTGYFENGTPFDSSNNNSFSFRLQKLEVIKGWDIAFSKMREGEKARIFIPWKLAYGKYGNPPKIPRKSNLVFDVELVRIVN